MFPMQACGYFWESEALASGAAVRGYSQSWWLLVSVIVRSPFVLNRPQEVEIILRNVPEIIAMGNSSRKSSVCALFLWLYLCHSYACPHITLSASSSMIVPCLPLCPSISDHTHYHSLWPVSLTVPLHFWLYLTSTSVSPCLSLCPPISDCALSYRASLSLTVPPSLELCPPPN